MTLVAGIDSSTQSCKVVIRELETGALVREGRAPHPGGTEVEPRAWWEALFEALAKAGGLSDVVALSVAAQQHGMVVLDHEGAVIRPALLWNDTRSATAARELIDEFGRAALAERTGSVPVASFTATKLRWLLEAEPENASRVAAVALPHDWLTWRLLGYGPREESPLGPDFDALVTDRSDASGTCYWNPRTGTYDEDILGWALGHVPALPRVLDPGARAGVTPSGVADVVPAGLQIGPGAGDNAAAALGLGASVGDVVVSIGTSGVVFAVSGEPVTDKTGGIAGFADATGAYLPLIATLNAARVLDATAQVLGVDNTELGRLARTAPPGSRGLVLQPYFEGERTPNLPDATATLFHMTLASWTRPTLARAAIEGLLCGLADGLDALRACGVVPSRLLLIGGAAAEPAVADVAAQVFDVPVTVPEKGEYVANGAARQAGWVYLDHPVSWTLAIASRPAMDPHPEIRRQYARHTPEADA
jgi:xylulokinase